MQARHACGPAWILRGARTVIRLVSQHDQHHAEVSRGGQCGNEVCCLVSRHHGGRVGSPVTEGPPSGSGSDAPPPRSVGATGRLVLKNALFLTFARAVGVPLSILMSAMLARYLGASKIGTLYLVQTFCSLGFLAVEWGHNSALPALVAQDRDNAGRLLGASSAWRGGAALLVYVVLAAVCHLMGYGVEVQIPLALAVVQQSVSQFASAGQSIVMGFERTDVTAIRQVLEQFAALTLIVPILLLGGSLEHTLMGDIGAAMIAVAYVWYSVRRMGIRGVRVDFASMKLLTRMGAAFVAFGVALVLQPYVDAVFLSKLSSEEVVGWHAAARRLVGFLVFPGSALVGALYPTLCRLHSTDQEQFRVVASGSLRGTTLLVVPLALCCALYPEVGVMLYGRGEFAPSAGNLRILSIFVFLVYFTMPLGCAVVAMGKQRIWAGVQFVCVGVSLVADPLLIPKFQAEYGNGGLGVCVAAVASEVVVLIGGIALVPRAIFDQKFWRALLLSCLAGVAMAGVAIGSMTVLNPFLSAPLAVLTYGIVIWRTGAIDDHVIVTVRRSLVRRFPKLARFVGYPG